MSFIVRKTKYRAWPVTVKQQQCDDAGEVTETESTFVAHWAPFTEEEIEELIKKANKKHPSPKVKVPAPLPPVGVGRELVGEFIEEEGPVPMSVTFRRNAFLFGEIMVGWGSEVKDEAGQAIPFSKDVLASLVTGPDGLAVSTGLHRALLEIRFGVAREKNSLASPAPGVSSVPAEAETSLLATSPSSA